MKLFENSDSSYTDLSTLAEDARALFAATADATDERVVEARRRLESALGDARSRLRELRRRAADGVRAADQAVHEHPYPALAVALGVGALIGCLLCRRDR